jgi:type IV pilus assembly protein PilA
MLAAALRKRHEREDEGFTLIELMVVVLIIAILLAIAIPTFLGAQNRAKDRAAQSDLRNALTAAKTLATDYEGLFKDANTGTASTDKIDAASMFAAEGSLTFVDGTSPNGAGSVTHIGVTVPDDFTKMLLVKRSKSDKWFGVLADKGGAVSYCKSDAASHGFTITNCTATSW